MAYYTQYNIVDKGQLKQYPNWGKGLPNLRTFLTAINRSQPIIGSQFELVWSRWPRTIFFAKNITIPGVSVNTIDLNHAGFTIPIPTHATYENTEISMNIIADKEGFHYYDIRNMVLQSGHPLVAGDPRAAVGNQFGIDTSEDTLKIRLRNKPTDETHHFWTIHNFHPIGIGDMELSMDSASFVEFELKGTFTHITYKCGDMPLPDDPNDFSFGDTDNNGVIDSDDPNDFSFGPGVDDEVERPKDNFNNEPYDNPEEQYMGDDNDQEEELPEDWKYMSDDDKQAYRLMKDGMSEEEAQNAIKEEIKKENPDISEDDLEDQSKAAIQNATAAMNTQENKAASPNDVDTKLDDSEQQQFQNEFSDSKSAENTQTQKTQIAGEDFDGKNLSQKQMATMEMGMAMGNSYPPEIMSAYNAQKGK